MDDSDATVAILNDIRDAIGDTNRRLDGILGRLGDPNAPILGALGSFETKICGQLRRIDGIARGMLEQERSLVRALERPYFAG